MYEYTHIYIHMYKYMTATYELVYVYIYVCVVTCVSTHPHIARRRPPPHPPHPKMQKLIDLGVAIGSIGRTKQACHNSSET